MNDNELEKMVLETYRMTKENREMLKRIDGRQQTAQTMKVLRWVIGIIVLVALYFVLRPYFGTIQAEIRSIQSTAATVQSLLPGKTQ